jgi:hypothetical protein
VSGVNPRGKQLATLIALICVLASVILIVLLRDRKEAVTFNFVDGGTGASITNVSVSEWETWTTLPLDAIGIPGVNSYHSRRRYLQRAKSSSVFQPVTSIAPCFGHRDTCPPFSRDGNMTL